MECLLLVLVFLNVETSFVPLGKVPILLRIIELQTQEAASQAKKFSAFLGKRKCKSQDSLSHILYTLANWGLWSCILSFLKVHNREWLEWLQFKDTPFSGLTGSHWRASVTNSISQGFPSWSWMTIIWETFHDQRFFHGDGRLIPDQSKNSWYVTLAVEFWTTPHQ